jgi:hypothetical protein
MKTRHVIWVALVTFLGIPVYSADSPAAAGATPSPASQMLTPPSLSPSAAEVVKLSGAGLGDEVILAYVKNCQVPFNLSASAVLLLNEAGISSPVIVAMLSHDGSLRNQNPPAQYAGGQQPQPVIPDVAPADQSPPPAPEEVIPVAPGPDDYWTPGYWGWNGGWIWIGGSWGFRGGYGWGGHYYGRGWYGRGGWGGYHGSGGLVRGGGGAFHGGSSVFHSGGSAFHSAGSFHGGGGGFHGGGGGHGGGGHGR